MRGGGTERKKERGEKERDRERERQRERERFIVCVRYAGVQYDLRLTVFITEHTEGRTFAVF